MRKEKGIEEDEEYENKDAEEILLKHWCITNLWSFIVMINS